MIARFRKLELEEGSTVPNIAQTCVLRSAWPRQLHFLGEWVVPSVSESSSTKGVTS